MTDGMGLEALARQARAELALFEYPAKPWVVPRTGPDGAPVRDVVIVGGGQSGLAVAGALLREHIDNIEVLDAGVAGQEGPWITTARMVTLRTLKFLTGPDLGLPALTYRARHEAQFGAAAWDTLVRIPKEDWMRYLVWLRATLGIPVRNGVRLERIVPHPDLVELHLDGPDGPEVRFARKLVLATGIEGAGRRRVPGFVAQALPRDRWAHSADRIDFTALAGKRVAVVGAGASAFDNAATALEHGAARVDVLVRRAALPEVNSARALETAGFFRNFGDAPDDQRWRIMRHVLSLPMPPPQDTLERCFRHPNAHLHLGTPLTGVEDDGAAIRLRTPQGGMAADFLILGTGYGVDLAQRPELADLAPGIATWADCYTPPPGQADALTGSHPYLGRGFELTPLGGAPPGLAHIHLFNIGAMVSAGPVAGGLNGMPWGVPRLVQALSRALFIQGLDATYAAIAGFDAPDAWEQVRAPQSAPAGRSAA